MASSTIRCSSLILATPTQSNRYRSYLSTIPRSLSLSSSQNHRCFSLVTCAGGGGNKGGYKGGKGWGEDFNDSDDPWFQFKKGFWSVCDVRLPLMCIALVLGAALHCIIEWLTHLKENQKNRETKKPQMVQASKAWEGEKVMKV